MKAKMIIELIIQKSNKLTIHIILTKIFETQKSNLLIKIATL
jgi:hypothetical protein